jgi:hypothetical protein
MIFQIKTNFKDVSTYLTSVTDPLLSTECLSISCHSKFLLFPSRLSLTPGSIYSICIEVFEERNLFEESKLKNIALIFMVFFIRTDDQGPLSKKYSENV